MTTYEVKTPALKTVTDGLLGIFSEAANGQVADVQQATLAVKTASQITNAIGQDLKNRIAMPKLVALEAKLVSQEKQEQIGQAAA